MRCGWRRRASNPACVALAPRLSLDRTRCRQCLARVPCPRRKQRAAHGSRAVALWWTVVTRATHAGATPSYPNCFPVRCGWRRRASNPACVALAPWVSRDRTRCRQCRARGPIEFPPANLTLSFVGRLCYHTNNGNNFEFVSRDYSTRERVGSAPQFPALCRHRQQTCERRSVVSCCEPCPTARRRYHGKNFGPPMA